jgi:uncharacterized membrane protein YdjX (TVP38/TMEM64 family)
MRLYGVIFGIVLVLLLPMLWFGDSIDQAFGGEEGLVRLKEFGAWAWLAGIGLIVGDLVLPVPSTAVTAILGMIYGPLLGGLLGGVGSILAGLVAYGGCRLIGERFLRFMVGEADLEKLTTFFARHGLWAIALSRWMPLLPEALCCLAGMVRMKFGRFLAALSVGSLAMGFAFSYLGMAYIDSPVAGTVISALIPLAVWPPVHWYLHRRERARTQAA